MGAGSWGTTLAKVFADAGSTVTIWARRPQIADTINTHHHNPDYLPGIQLPTTLTATTNPTHALAGATIVVLAVPSQTLRDNRFKLHEIAHYLQKKETITGEEFMRILKQDDGFAPTLPKQT